MTAENFDSLITKWETFEDSISLGFNKVLKQFAQPTSDVENYAEVVIMLEREKRKLLDELKTLIAEAEGQNKAKREGLESLINEAYKNNLKKLAEIKVFKEDRFAFEQALAGHSVWLKGISGTTDADLSNAINLLDQKIKAVKDAMEKADKNLDTNKNLETGDFFSASKKISALLEDDFPKDRKKIEFNLGVAKAKQIMPKWNENLKNYNAAKEALKQKMAEYEPFVKILDISNPLTLEAILKDHEAYLKLPDNILENHAYFQEMIDKVADLTQGLKKHVEKIEADLMSLKLSALGKAPDLQEQYDDSIKKYNEDTQKIDSIITLKQTDIAKVKSEPVFLAKLDGLRKDAHKHITMFHQAEKDISDDLKPFKGAFRWFWKAVRGEQYYKLSVEHEKIGKKVHALIDLKTLLSNIDQHSDEVTTTTAIDKFLNQHALILDEENVAEGNKLFEPMVKALKSIQGTFQTAAKYQVDISNLTAEKNAVPKPQPSEKLSQLHRVLGQNQETDILRNDDEFDIKHPIN